MGTRFIHTADWQLGKPFGGFDAGLSGRLSAARQEVISRIAAAADQHGAAHVVVAGDVWDSATPSGPDLRQPLAIMGEHPGLTWWLMPGNHDPDGPDGLWDRVDAIAPDNVRTLRAAEPVAMEPGAWLLAAPWARLHPGEDLSAWMDSAETPDGSIRIGVAHGSVRRFGTQHDSLDDGDSDGVIAPDRARSARLDYLALGDWHGRRAINARTHYSGTPEPDRHKSGARGQVLLVEIDGPGAEPRVTDVPTARYGWPVIEARLRVDGLGETVSHVRAAVSDGPPLRDVLADIRVDGTTTLAEWAEFERFIETLTGDCAHLELKGTSGVALAVMPADLDSLDAQGSVRAAAETLQARREDPALSQDDRELAGEALRLLFSIAASDGTSSGGTAP